MDDIKTVDVPLNIIDPLRTKQKEDVARMRASLLSCTSEHDMTAQQALKNISVLRIYHQISRIIRYTELMDKLEEKLYESISNTIDAADEFSPSTWIQLLTIQEKLQKSMIESHKLLQPYLDLESYNIIDLVPSSSVDSTNTVLLDAHSREKLRMGAQAVLMELDGGGAASGQ